MSLHMKIMHTCIWVYHSLPYDFTILSTSSSNSTAELLIRKSLLIKKINPSLNINTSSLPLTVKLIIFQGGKSWVCRYFWDSTGTCCEKCNFGPSSWESNPWPPESSAMLCQLSYGGRYREHGHEFSIYNGVIREVVGSIPSQMAQSCIFSNRSQLSLKNIYTLEIFLLEKLST